jgi:hypothetical protein
MRIAMALLALALATTGCKKKEATPTGETTGSGSAMVESGSAMAGSDMAGSGSAMAGSGDMAGSAMAGSGDMAGSGAGSGDAMSKHAGNCPSTVLGSTTKAEVKGKDVVVTITSDDKDAVTAIQMRAEAIVKEKSDNAAAGSGAAAGGHDQKGSHGGGVGICPVHLPEGATAKVKKEKNGASVTITPKADAAALKTEIDARITKAADWVKSNIKPGDKENQGGVGGGTNKEGANHSGQGDGKGKDRKSSGSGSGGGDGKGGGAGTGGGGGKGTGGGGGSGSAK